MTRSKSNARHGIVLGAASVTAALVGGALVLVGSPPAEPEQQLRVGLYQNPPKIYAGDDGVPAGFFPGLLDRVAAEENWRITYVPCSWSDCLDLLRAGELDLMPDVAASPQRRETMAFHQVPVVQAWSQVYAPAEARISSLEDLAARGLAVLGGSVQHERLRTWQEVEGHDYQIVTVATMDEAFTRVEAGEAAAAVANNFFGRRHAMDSGLTETPITFGLSNLYFAARPDAGAALLETLDAYFSTWKAEPDSPYYDVLREATAAPEAREIPVWLLPLLAVSLGGALIAGGMAWLLRWQVKRRTRELRESTRRLQHVLDSSPVVIYSLSGPRLTPDWISGNIERILGVSVAEVMRPDWWREHLHPDDRDVVEEETEELCRRSSLVQEYRVIDDAGSQRHIRDEKQVVETADDGTPLQVIGSWTDMTESRQQQARMETLAHFDGVTGLPNRALLHQRIEDAVLRAGDADSHFAVVLLDLDRFKSINETLGMSAGDELLEAVARRLSGLVRPGDTVARVGGDGFGVVLASEVNALALTRWLDQLLVQFREPLRIAGQELIITISAGVAGYPADGRTREELVTGAELAMEAARRAGGDCWVTYDASLGERSSRRLFLESDLRRAVANGEFVLHYQPQFVLATGQLAGVEALVRWRQPERGMVPPDEFIPLAEETGLISQIDRWVMAEACRQLAQWDAAGISVPRVAVNLSARELHDGELLSWLRSQLEANGLSPGRFEVEITETRLMEFPEQALPLLQQLADLGVHLAMDDFGSGYSNLAHLEGLPLHRLKIDRSLIWDIGKGPQNDAIVRAVLAMARALHLEVVAEGIEDDAQSAFLEGEGCWLGQGFFLGRPVSPGRLVVTLDQDAPERG